MDLSSWFKLIEEEDVKWICKSYGWPSIETIKTGGLVLTHPPNLGKSIVNEQTRYLKLCLANGRNCGKQQVKNKQGGE